MSKSGLPSFPFKTTCTEAYTISHKEKKPLTIRDNAFNQKIVLLPLGR